MAPDIEKRTVSSAHVPDLDGDRLAVQEHRQYWGRRRQIAKGIVVWAQPGNDRHHCGAASAPRPGFAGSSAIEGTAVMRRRGRVRLFMTRSCHRLPRSFATHQLRRRERKPHLIRREIVFREWECGRAEYRASPRNSSVLTKLASSCRSRWSRFL